jgi:2-dehydropantoate 2-reductase
MKTLIVGMGALGGTIATRGINAGMSVYLATRTDESAQALKRSGLNVSGVGGSVEAQSKRVKTLDEYARTDKFDLIVLATKAQEALEIAPILASLLNPEGTLLPIQNGGVAQLLAQRLGSKHVLGGISNLGATMVAPGVYEQRNAGHLLIGELEGGFSHRAENIAKELQKALDIRVTPNMQGSIWSKLLLNCSVTTLGAVAGQNMRQYMTTSFGRALFQKTYDEALRVALAKGVKPDRMLVEPVPPGWDGSSVLGKEYDDWIGQIMTSYGDLKPSMLQDFERGRKTEIDFINGYVAQVGKVVGVLVTLNEATTRIVHRIEQGEIVPNPCYLEEILSTSCTKACL